MALLLPLLNLPCLHHFWIIPVPNMCATHSSEGDAQWTWSMHVVSHPALPCAQVQQWHDSAHNAALCAEGGFTGRRTSRPKKVPVEVRTVESMLFPVSLSTTVLFTMLGFACSGEPPTGAVSCAAQPRHA